jgi:hypothetical protein
MSRNLNLRRVTGALILWILTAVSGLAQNTATGTLLVSMSVQSSISVEFVNVSGAGNQGTCSITGANTNTASVNFGIASLSGDNQSCVSFSQNGSSYTLSNNIYTVVTQSNLTSSNFTLTASLGSSPTTGVVWSINSATLGTGSTSITTGGNYGANTSMYLQVTVQHTVASGSLNEVISLTATAN